MQSLQGRILSFFLVLLVLVLGVILTTVYRTTYGHTRDQVEDNLEHGHRIFRDKLESRQRSLHATAETLAKDDALRQAIFVDSADEESLLVALNNHRLRTGAELALIVELDGTILVHTTKPAARGETFPVPEILTESTSDEEVRIVPLDGELFQLVAVPYYVPVSAPRPSLWLLLGLGVDDDLARTLSDLTGFEVAFLIDGQFPEPVVASSVSGTTRRALAGTSLSDGDELRRLRLGDEEYLFSTTTLLTAGPEGLIGVLMRSTREAFLDFRRLSAQVLGIVLVAALMVVIGAFVIARGITRPLRSLSEVARRIAGGEYAAELPDAGGGEVGKLAREFGKMQREIQGRQEAIQFLAYHDDLTGLPNRNRFRLDLGDALEEARERRERLAVAVLDLDRFKDINDTLGHHVGDRLLMEVARRLEDVDDGDPTVARLGGDEFALLFPGVGIAEARGAVAEVRRLLSEPIDTDEIRLEVQASVGIAVYPDHGGDPASLLKQAEVAMYVAKERWMGLAFYESSEDRHSVHRLSLMSDLRRAVEEDELRLVYQPETALSTGAVEAVEALVRWNHPRLGPVGPGEFVPIAEQTGTVRHLTRWVLRTVTDQLESWRDRSLDLPVAVNLSARDLHDREFPDWLAAVLAERAVSPELLVLEVTESSVMADPETAREILDRLAEMGARVSIDDFGTGYSSLAQIRRLPVHEIKIDRSFVVEMERSQEVRLIVRSTIELGHNLGLRVVAEGVESEETLDLLQGMGCDLAQGRHLSEALDPETLSDRLRPDRRSFV